MQRPSLRTVAGIVTAAVSFIVVDVGWYMARPSVHLVLERGRPLPEAIVRGFYEPETSPDGTPFAWTNGDARITLGDLDRRTGWLANVRFASGAWPATGPAPIVSVEVDGQERWTARPAISFADHEVTAPRKPGRLGLIINLRSPTFVPGAADPRSLGVVVNQIVLSPQGPVPPPLTRIGGAAVSGSSLAIACAAAGLGPVWVAAIVTMLGMISGWLSRVGSATFLPYVIDMWKVALWAGALTVLPIAAGALIGRPSSRALRLALVISMAAVYVKHLFLFHPDMMVGDTVFHLHRLEGVVAGTYYFTSVAPGGEFPYPIALYVVASWLRWMTGDWVSLMRTIVAIADAAAGLSVFRLAAMAVGSPLAGLCALALYHLTPATFQVHGTAYLTNAFGQAIAVVALFGVSTLQGNRPSTWRFAGSTLAIAVALLSHVSTAAILSVTLAATCLLYFWSAVPDLRSAARSTGAAALLAAVLATVLYYGHFSDTYRSMLVRRASVPAAMAEPGIPVQKPEAHQTVWAPGWQPFANRALAVPGYLAKYFGWGLLAMAVFGGRALAGGMPRSRMTLLMTAWWSSCVLFLALGVLTPIDMRYYLAAAPVAAILAAVAIHEGARPGGPLRFGALAMLSWLVVSGVHYWFEWLSTTPPR